MKFSFVILHYLTYEDTDECIESILNNIDYPDYDIVLVDNASTNDSLQKLEKKYGNHEKVYFVKNDANLGFAKGNNSGYKFAKDELNSDFVVMINNDTIIEQRDFLSVILEKYKQTNFDILGPDIVSTQDGLHQNPNRNRGFTEEEVKTEMKKLQTKLMLNYLGLEDLILKLYRTVRKNPTPIAVNKNWEEEQENVVLHGSALIFSPNYVKKYNGLYSKTFLYMEEDILYYIAQKENLKILYTPAVRIYHKEDSSTNAVYQKETKKRRFVYKHVIASSKEFLRLRQDDTIYKEDLLN